ncbi:MAG: PilZ domain-containing protein [Acidobacteria bacterium]|nr:PilZ domain-containing protein [Acidobacteriota bacterium]
MGRENTRRYPRYEVQNVEGTFLYNLPAEILNMSVGGMALETRRALEIKRIYMFSIHKGNQTVKIPGRVAWCVLRRTEHVSDTEVVPIYHAGIQFNNVLTEQAQSLLHLIEESALLDVNQRLFGRFIPDDGTQVTIDNEVEFSVLKISLSGMLIETMIWAEVEDVLPMEVQLPDQRIKFRGRIAFVGTPAKRETSLSQIHLGVEFLDLSGDHRQSLEGFIATVVEADLPLNGTLNNAGQS